MNLRPDNSSTPPSSSIPLPVWSEQRLERRNLAALAAYQIVLRIGWIFKTESVIIPAFLDRLAGPAWLRGMLPVLNRFGQSVPPLLLAARVQSLPEKKRGVACATLLMAAAVFLMSLTWLFHPGGASSWAPLVFLAAYASFFASHGTSQLAFNTLQGKVIRPSRRGRLLLISDTLGTLLSISLALWLLRRWLLLEGGGFEYIFAFAAGAFLIAGGVILVAREPGRPQAARGQDFSIQNPSLPAILRGDRNFRRLALVVSLYSTVQILFPHYQALALRTLGLSLSNMVTWVIVQNATVGLCSVIAGEIADRYGTVLAMRTLMLAGACSPLLALAMAAAGPSFAARYYWAVFIPVGFTPLAFKTLHLYTLEIAPPDQEARYLSATSMMLALPFSLSPLAGWLIDRFGFPPVFAAGSVLILLAGLFTFTLREPRLSPDQGGAAGPVDGMLD